MSKILDLFSFLLVYAWYRWQLFCLFLAILKIQARQRPRLRLENKHKLLRYQRKVKRCTAYLKIDPSNAAA